jgi:hypothetical protein
MTAVKPLRGVVEKIHEYFRKQGAEKAKCKHDACVNCEKLVYSLLCVPTLAEKGASAKS